MILPISSANINSKNLSCKSNMNKLQDEIDVFAKKELITENKGTFSCLAALILTVLAIGATITTVVKSNKEKALKQTIENVIQKDTTKANSIKNLDILK